jgi:Tol biopolymer transport system component/uncharacterized membrane protein YbhN (UPF0104 family)
MKRGLFLGLSLALTVMVFAVLLRTVKPADVLDLIRNADRRGVAAFVVLSLSMSGFRTWRYIILLNQAGYRVGRAALYLVVLVRNLCSDLLPARIGTLVYIFLVTTRLGVPGGAATSSFSLSFVFDIVAVAPLLLVAASLAGWGGAVSPMVFAGGALVIGLAALGVVWLLPFGFGLAANLLHQFPILPGRMRVALAATFENAAADVRTARRSGIYGELLVLSVLVRLCKYAALVVFLAALLKPMGIVHDTAGIARSFVGICAAELAASLPVSGIAGFGAYEGTWSMVFQWLGFPAVLAQTTSISHHLFTQAYGYGLGLAALCLLLLPFFRRREQAPSAPRRPAHPGGFALRTLAATGAVAGLTMLCYAVIPARVDPPAGKADVPAPADQAAQAAMALTLNGDIVFDSNRSGTFGIYALDVAAQRVRTVADSEFQDMYPDPSPDGSWFVYARAFTTARLSPADIYLCDAQGGQSRRLAQDGTFPTFSADGGTVYFERGRRSIVSVRVADGHEIVRFPRSSTELSGRQIVKPRVSPDGRYAAFTCNAPRDWNVWIVDLETEDLHHVDRGCEPAWFPDSQSLAFIAKEGMNERSGIRRYHLSTGKSELLQDAGAPRGHEYFPTLAPAADVLLYASCRPGEHSHLTANYQLFAASLPMGAPVRLTFSPSTDRWPKLLPRPR